jgi:hypothetical protein
VADFKCPVPQRLLCHLVRITETLARIKYYRREHLVIIEYFCVILSELYGTFCGGTVFIAYT